MSGSEDLIAEARSLAAARAGLPAEWGGRLKGSTIAEVEADAAAFRESLDAMRGPATPPARTLDGGVQREPQHITSLDAARDLARRAPGEFNRLVDEGLLNPSELAKEAG